MGKYEDENGNYKGSKPPSIDEILNDAAKTRIKNNIRNINYILEQYNAKVEIITEDKYGEERHSIDIVGLNRLKDYRDTYCYREYEDEIDVRLEAISEFLVCLYPLIQKGEEELQKASLTIASAGAITERRKI